LGFRKAVDTMNLPFVMSLYFLRQVALFNSMLPPIRALSPLQCWRANLSICPSLRADTDALDHPHDGQSQGISMHGTWNTTTYGTGVDGHGQSAWELLWLQEPSGLSGIRASCWNMWIPLSTLRSARTWAQKTVQSHQKIDFCCYAKPLCKLVLRWQDRGSSPSPPRPTLQSAEKQQLPLWIHTIDLAGCFGLHSL